MWDLRSGQHVRVLKGHSRSVTCCQVDGDKIVRYLRTNIENKKKTKKTLKSRLGPSSGAQDGTVRFWDWNGREQVSVPVGSTYAAFQFASVQISADPCAHGVHHIAFLGIYYCPQVLCAISNTTKQKWWWRPALAKACTSSTRA
jgi:hypothetical protein